MWVWAVLLLNAAVYASEFEAFNCEDPKEATFFKNSDCQKNRGHRLQESITIVQEKVSNLTAVRCELIETAEVGYCGHSSVTKLTDQSYFSKQVRISAANCRTIAESGTLKWSGLEHRIEMNAVNYIDYFTHGSVKFSTDNVACMGESLRLKNGDVVSNMLRRVSLQVRVHKEVMHVRKGRVATKGGVMVGYANQGVGKSGTSTYIWSPLEDECEKVTTGIFPMESLDGVNWFSHVHKIQIEKKQKRYDDKCSMQVYETDFQDVFIMISEDARTEEINVNSVNLNAQIQAQLNYNRAELKRKLNTKYDMKSDEICHYLQRMDVHENTQMGGEKFLRNIGDIAVSFECKKSIVSADNQTSDCYKQLPVKDREGKQWFLEPNTRILMKEGEKTTCSVVHVPALQTTDGRVVIHNPEEKEVSVEPIEDKESEEEVDGYNGLYPKEIVNAYLQNMLAPTIEEKWTEYTERGRGGQVMRRAAESVFKQYQELTLSKMLFGIDWDYIGNRCSIIVVGLAILYAIKVAVGVVAKSCIVYGGGEKSIGQSLMIGIFSQWHLLNEDQKKKGIEKQADKNDV